MNTDFSIAFEIVECSSEAEGFEGSKLQTYRADGDGWLSKKGCSYPQFLVLRVEHDKVCVIDRLDILSNEIAISQRIEIVIGSEGIEGETRPTTFDECASIVRLGHVTMDPNRESNFKDRELKSVPIGKRADLVKLTLHEPYANEHNRELQVGIAGLRLIGGETQGRVMNSELTNPLPKSLPPHIRKELDPKIQGSLDRLERLKKERAAVEDFDMALNIHSRLREVYARLILYKECDGDMRKAAISEEYAVASRLKIQRDIAKDEAMSSLHEVEEEFVGNMNDLSLSTIKDESFMSQKSTRSIQHFCDSDQISVMGSPFKCNSSNHNESSIQEHNLHDFSNQSSSDNLQDDNSDVPHVHPLAGIENAEELPPPEDISKDISTDLIHKVEDLFGSYISKCLFSKNWQLRDAALAKMSLIVPELFDMTPEDCAEMTSILSLVISRAIDDNNVQVYQSALILLDAMLIKCEQQELPQVKVSLLLSKIIADILSKLADGSRKVVESAELSLLAMAHSPCVDVSTISNAATKKIRTAESKGGRTVKARLQFLEHLIAEFNDQVPFRRVLDFAKSSKSFDHKDIGVRDATKAVVLMLMMVHGENLVLQYLGDCEQINERARVEYRAKYAAVRRSME
eukprot:scaffold15417_cov71-Cyclotella_meneghiniana.AAC.4